MSTGHHQEHSYGHAMGEDDFIYWQDVLDEIAAGRRDKLRCPFCQGQGLKIEQKGPGVRIECGACRHYIEGRFPIDPTSEEPQRTSIKPRGGDGGGG